MASCVAGAHGKLRCLIRNGTYLGLFSIENSMIISYLVLQGDFRWAWERACSRYPTHLVRASLLAISDAIASKLATTTQFRFNTKKSLSKCRSSYWNYRRGPWLWGV